MVNFWDVTVSDTVALSYTNVSLKKEREKHNHYVVVVDLKQSIFLRNLGKLLN